jgi:lipopolysaccharide export system permease protein
MFKLIDRYLLREILTPFALTLGALMLILLTDQLLRLVELLINKGISLLTVLKIFLSILPAFLVIALPAGVLIGIIIAFNRLSTDNEIIALQANGISLYRLLWPAMQFSVIALALTFSLSVWAKPWAGRSLKDLGISLVRQQAAVGLEAGMFNELFEDVVIYVEELPVPDRLAGVLIYDLRDPQNPVLTLAKEGAVFNDPEKNILGFRLLQGHQYRFDPEEPGRNQVIRFSTYEFKMDLNAVLNDPGSTVEPSTPEAIKRAMEEDPERAGRYRRLLGEHYKNYAFPFSCLIFGLVGVPLGAAVRRAGRLGGFTVGLFLALVYYILVIAADFVTALGTVPPALAVWSPNLIMATVGVVLIVHTNHRMTWLRRWMG